MYINIIHFVPNNHTIRYAWMHAWKMAHLTWQVNKIFGSILNYIFHRKLIHPRFNSNNLLQCYTFPFWHRTHYSFGLSGRLSREFHWGGMASKFLLRRLLSTLKLALPVSEFAGFPYLGGNFTPWNRSKLGVPGYYLNSAWKEMPQIWYGTPLSERRKKMLRICWFSSCFAQSL